MTTNTEHPTKREAFMNIYHTKKSFSFNQKPINFPEKFMLYQQFKLKGSNNNKKNTKLHESLINFSIINTLRAMLKNKKYFPYHE